MLDIALDSSVRLIQHSRSPADDYGGLDREDGYEMVSGQAVGDFDPGGPCEAPGSGALADDEAWLTLDEESGRSPSPMANAIAEGDLCEAFYCGPSADGPCEASGSGALADDEAWLTLDEENGRAPSPPADAIADGDLGESFDREPSGRFGTSGDETLWLVPVDIDEAYEVGMCDISGLV